MKNLLSKNIFFYIVLILTTNLLAKDNYSIQWKLENPFKFFKDPNIYKKMKIIYDDLNKIDIEKYEDSKGLAFERALQSDKWEKKRYLGEKLGWAADFAYNYGTSTYWNRKTMTYDNNYIHPEAHNIIVNLKNVTNEECKWFIDGKEKSNKKCSEEAVLPIPYDGSFHSIKAIVNNNPKLSIENKNIMVKDTLIVGLGDSYGSGEGNPDKPIIHTKMGTNKDNFFVKNRYLPRKRKGDSAQWIDRRAHRSMYSYQFKTALQYSIEHPKEAVTFVSFSSSGAISDNIIGKHKKSTENLKDIEPLYDKKIPALDILAGKEDTRISRKSNIRPQIELLKEAIKDREIDYLLLSIGGNDIGFASYVMNILFDKNFKKVDEKVKNKIDAVLFENYHRLNNILKGYLKGEDSERIILTAYSNILKDENNVLCKGDKREFNIPFGKKNREQRIIDTEKYIIEPLYKIQKNLAKELNWSFVDGHREKFESHGFCAKNQNTLIPQNEKFLIPYKVNKEEKGWISFQPKDYHPYGLKQRWVQLPVDSILMINRTQDFLGFRTDFLFSDETSGIFHPTADGLAVEADENVKLINKKFGNKE